MRVTLFLMISLVPMMGFSQTTLRSSIADSTENQIFRLGEVTVTVSKADKMKDRLTSIDMEAQNKMEVSNALNMLPGINLTASGARNESMVTVRGFDLRQVPVYMDGIPVYVPYDGYVDLARFTTFDLSAIDVSKGFSSILYGPNSLGGAINLISRKPTEELEFDGSIGIINANGYRGNVNVGSDFGKFYIETGYAYLHRDSYIMSSKYDSSKNEDGHERDNSYRRDKKFNFKIGWTPKGKNEYALGYVNQQGQKGTPVYCGTDTLNSMLNKPRFWQWPTWNKETYYFLSNTNLNSESYMKIRLYYDIFKNTINSYDDATYTTQVKPYAFQSLYNDYTYGGSIEYGTTIIPKNNLKVALHFKEDIHRENNQNESVLHFNDNTITIGFEDVYKVTNKFVVIPGISYSARRNLQAEDYNSSTKVVSDFAKAGTSIAYNEQLGIFYYLKNHNKIGVSISQKTRFATIKDRYSYHMGTAIPNPDLKPETAINYELNYSGEILKKITFQTALFYSHISDAILSISNVQLGKSQMQNAGKAEFLGVEAGIRYYLMKNFLLGANYTYIERNNLTSPSVHFTDVPNTKVFGYLQYLPIKQIRMMASTEYNSSRFSTSYGIHAPEFTLVNIMVSSTVWKYISLEIGINNVFDTNYCLVEGFPEEGRNFFMTLRFFNHGY